MDIAANVLAFGMANDLVTAMKPRAQALVRGKLIRVDCRAAIYVLDDCCLERPAADIRNYRAVNLSAATDNREHGRFLCAASGRMFASAGPWLATDIGFVALNDAFELRPAIGCESEANPVHQEQGGLVANLALPLNLQCGNALLAGRGSPERVAPMAQGQSAFLVDRTNANRVLLFAIVTAPEKSFVAFARLGIAHLVNILGLAVRAAGRTIPALRLHEFHGGKLARAGQRNVSDDLRCLQVGRFRVLHGGNFILSAIGCQILFSSSKNTIKEENRGSYESAS